MWTLATILQTMFGTYSPFAGAVAAVETVAEAAAVAEDVGGTFVVLARTGLGSAAGNGSMGWPCMSGACSDEGPKDASM